MPPPATASKQDSLITIDWVGPSLAQVGEVVDYALQVRNTSALALNKVQANVRVAREGRQGAATRVRKSKPT